MTPRAVGICSEPVRVLAGMPMRQSKSSDLSPRSELYDRSDVSVLLWCERIGAMTCGKDCSLPGDPGSRARSGGRRMTSTCNHQIQLHHGAPRRMAVHPPLNLTFIANSALPCRSSRSATRRLRKGPALKQPSTRDLLVAFVAGFCATQKPDWRTSLMETAGCEVGRRRSIGHERRPVHLFVALPLGRRP